ncbi:MAG: hypothetical protein RLZZ241_644 [Bacteroidota bacterium]
MRDCNSLKVLKSYVTILLLVFGYGIASAQIQTIQRPIIWDSLRIQLTQEYLQSRYGITSRDGTITPKMVVLHWTAIPSLQASFEAFNAPTLPNARADISGGGALNVSAHYLVDRDGTIYQLMPETLMARHTIGLNHCAVGIENVGGTPETPLTKKQLRANKYLIRSLANNYPIEYVIGHYEYTNFENHSLWLERDTKYRTTKIDPGEDFMRKIKRGIQKTGIKSAPANL